MEYDTDRAGGLEPLRFLPPNKRVFLGLVTTKSGAVSSRPFVRRRAADEAMCAAGGH